MAVPKFHVGDPVSHPADTDGRFPKGTGTVATVIPSSKTGEAIHYEIKCDATKALLPVAFEESELTAKK